MYEPGIFSSGKLKQDMQSGLFVMPDGQSMAQACDGWARMRGQPSIGIAAGNYVLLQALSGLVAASGDQIPVFMIGLIDRNQIEQATRAASALGQVFSLEEALDRFSRSTYQKDPLILSGAGPWLILGDQSQLKGLAGLLKLLRKLSVRYAIQAYKQRYALERPADKIAMESMAELQAIWRIIKETERPVVLLDRQMLEHTPVEDIRSFCQIVQAPLLLTTRAASAPPAMLDRLTQNIPWQRLASAPHLNFWKILFKCDQLIYLGTDFRESELAGLHDFKPAFWEVLQANTIRISGASQRVEGKQKDSATKDQVERINERHWQVSLLHFMQAIPDELKHIPGSADNHRAARTLWLQKTARWQQTYKRLIQKLIMKSGRAGSKSSPASPGFVARRVLETMEPDSVLLVEGSATGMWAWSARNWQPMLYPDRMASIGVLPGMAVGAGLAARARALDIAGKPLPEEEHIPGMEVGQRSLWGMQGEGSLLYDISLLKALRDHEIGINLIVFNNAAWSAIRLEQTFVFEGKYPGTRTPPQNLQALCAEHGIAARRVKSNADLKEVLMYAVRRSDRESAPFVIEVRTPADGIPLAGLPFALAELDYIYGSNRWRIGKSLIKSIFTGKFPWRLVRAALRLMV